MQELKCMMLKEFWEIRQSKAALLVILLGCAILIIALAVDDVNAMIPREIMVVLYPLAMAFAINVQIVLYSFINERKQRTLEVLLTLDLNRFSIVLGKILPSVLISVGGFGLMSIGIKIMLVLTGSSFLIR